MSVRTLRPLDYGALFDEVFDLYKRNVLLFVGIAGVVYLPLNILLQFLLARFMQGYMEALSSGVPDWGRLDWGALAIFLLASLAAVPFTYAVVAATTWAVSRCYLGERPSIIESYRAITPRLFPFVLTFIIVGLAQGLGFLFCCLPGLALFFIFAFVSEVFVLEGKEYFAAMRRSWDLVIGQWARVIVVGILTFVVALILQSIITAPFQVITTVLKIDPYSNASLSVGQGLAQGIAQTLVLPVQTICFVLLYYDIRVRREGFDIELLAAGVGAAPVGPSQDEIETETNR